MLKSAFGNKSLNMALGKDFEKFLKKTLKGLSKNREFNETYNAKDLVGGSNIVVPIVIYLFQALVTLVGTHTYLLSLVILN